eukprot:2966010-Rhodomonas_salina.2
MPRAAARSHSARCSTLPHAKPEKCSGHSTRSVRTLTWAKLLLSFSRSCSAHVLSFPALHNTRPYLAIVGIYARISRRLHPPHAEQRSAAPSAWRDQRRSRFRTRRSMLQASGELLRMVSDAFPRPSRKCAKESHS